jgi:2-hydroxy-3-keto-5-methylthiopentenyl-1-phosphate phosphatase
MSMDLIKSMKIFCDFDGTVCAGDVRTILSRTFGGAAAREAVDLWFRGELSGVECITRECAAAGEPDTERFNRIIDEQRLDPSFPDFVDYCRKHSIEIEILSDGYDYYIQRILNNHSITGIAWYANSLEIDNGKLLPGFPYFNPHCLRAANCKGTHVLNNAGDDQLRIMVGDGYSDRCGADYADIVFAKRHLVRYCREANISYYEFSDFNDIRSRLEELRGRKRLSPRYRAAVRRNEAFRIEANT